MLCRVLMYFRPYARLLCLSHITRTTINRVTACVVILETPLHGTHARQTPKHATVYLVTRLVYIKIKLLAFAC